ncbi:MAG: fumarylacetoacetate hydrolase family protein [Candidatus Thorarchaeota archaeon]|nr:fumarylacetoacetate hydrolase family protein [Candidatus Thorarchaeota archaeon]
MKPCSDNLMRLVTYTRMGVPSIGIELEDGVLDIPDAASRFGRMHHVHGKMFPSTMIDLLQWPAGVEVVRQILDRYNEATSQERPLLYKLSNVSFLAPIAQPGKIVAIGLNYMDHVEETGRETPKAPVVFAKFPSSIIGPGDDIIIPSVSKKIDWEVELGIVIGKQCKNIPEESVLDHIAGYTIINDLTARDLQREDGGQWVRGKSIDTFCPMGPCIVTSDELGDASGLKMHTKVNDVIKQESTTSNLIFNVIQLVSYLSKSFSLEPGDVIASGTPAGVGFTRNPPEYLKAGDEVELYIEGIDYLRNKVAAATE